MAKSKTGSFWLTETIALAAGTASGARAQGTIDLGAYVDVGDQQALAVEEVDYIFQISDDYGSNVDDMLVGNGTVTVQLSDLNPGTAFIRADDNSLVSSGALNIDQANNIASHSSDFYPDSYGTLDNARMIVNDSLYLVAGPDGAATSATVALYVTCRIKARIVKLSTKDWMSIAIQSTASDN
jgi:hypothetical protein